MNYTFACGCGYARTIDRSMSLGPPAWLKCKCGLRMTRDWQADTPMLDTSNCKDADFIPQDKRIVENVMGRTKAKAMLKEKKFREAISLRRKLLADGGNRGGFRHTHSVPADLFHGKIKETGDKNYWSEQRNVERHKSCKVS